MSFVRHVLLFSIVIDTFAVRTEHLLRCGPALSYVHLIQKVLHLYNYMYMPRALVHDVRVCVCVYKLYIQESL